MAREAGTLENSLEGAGLGSRSKVRGAGAARGWGSESRRVAAGFFQAREQFLSCLTHSETHRSLVHTGQCVCRECAHRTQPSSKIWSISVTLESSLRPFPLVSIPTPRAAAAQTSGLS